METIEYRTMDKTGWGEGDWQGEPDKKQWLDTETGYPCLIVRSDSSGSLCGYVGVPEGHPAYKKDYNDVDVSVHGGLTFAGECQKVEDEGRGVCHKADGEEDKVWWLGFDTAHFGDYMPRDYMPKMADYFQARKVREDEGEKYRNLAYVTEQVQDLARQLKRAEG